MKTLKVQEFLRNIGQVDYYTPATVHMDILKAKYGINWKQHSVHKEIFLVKYDQIESDFNQEIVRECRGLILDSSRNWEVVCCPFFKFGNIGESYVPAIDWKTARVQEKLDGSLCCLWYYKGWNVSTSGCPDGTNQINDSGVTFGELFWECFKKQGMSTDGLFSWYTYIFELTSPFNRVVVDYKESYLTLIGVRNLQTLKEVHPDKVCFEYAQTPRPKSYPLSSLEDCLNAANHLNPLEHEGFVVVDAAFNRVKIKSPAYVALHHIKDSCSLSKLAEIVRQGEFEEFMVAIESYPEIKEKFLEMVARYRQVVSDCSRIFNEIKGIQNQKEFALQACKTNFSSVLFSMRKTGKTPQAIIKDMLDNAYLRLIGVK
jgi:hypothetical protein